ncbi:amidohydrolase family protein [Kitasatospora sp. NBC_01287]|uniref:amidohydrolase family protein n=1 Tax=Kitasatospora sp. NBC_01287 TaxID=2903573 RepID=UPI0022501689|nr:amidohydrolase family protein [Kitasatospora sp. NBC_01287]MCX4744266.1 amidohydrolase family protein [Kitasatospora sp. NBC_01287]
MPETRPSALINTVYGAFVRRLGGWIPVSDLIALLAELDVGSQAVRSAISRLKKGGTLVQERRATGTGYRLSPAVGPVFDEGDRRIFGSLEPARLADGWVIAIFSVPESERAHRHQLRSRLSWLGFGNASPGVWLAPARLLPDAELMLRRLGLSDYVHLFTGEYAAFAELREAVSGWWDFPAIEHQYAEFADIHRPLAQRLGADPDPAAAFRAYVPMLTQWRRLPYLDPGLPTELLPADWNAVVARRVFAELHQLLAVPSLRYVEQVAGAPTGPAVENLAAVDQPPGTGRVRRGLPRPAPPRCSEQPHPPEIRTEQGVPAVMPPAMPHADLVPPADLVLRAAAVHTLVPGQAPQRALAVKGGRIAALAPDPAGLDDWIGLGTAVLDQPAATVLPAFDDTHTHLILAADSVHDVPVHRARDLAGFLKLIRLRAATTPPGEWIRTTINWQEFNLAERRLPTMAELDAAAAEHPVLVKRGAYNVVLNSAALRLTGLGPDTPDPAGGRIERAADGSLTGRLIGSAAARAEALLPRPDLVARIEDLHAASRAYAATGIGTVRDCMVPLADLPVLRAAREAGALAVRVRALVSAIGLNSVAQVQELLAGMESWQGADDDQLSVWGVKFGIDGGIEAGALEQPYAGRDCYCGSLNWEPEALVEAVDAVVRRGWRVGSHAWGDRGLRVLLDVYEEVLRRHPDLPAGTLVIEHGGLARPEQRTRAIELGLPVTVQHPLLHDAAGAQIREWGAERVADLFPLREWLDEGALLTAGSDFPVGPFGAMTSVWGMTTRQTLAGVQGPGHAITRPEAFALHTVNAARLTGESVTRGTLAPGRFADLTLWPADPLRCPDLELATLLPDLTLIGGRAVHDPHGLLASP